MPTTLRRTDAWSVHDSDFPATGTAAEKLRFLLRYAILAPSSHNSQPWLFRVDNDTVDLHADRSRALPVADPDDRELVMSCGAALFNLWIAVRHFGHWAELETLPDSPAPDMLLPVRHVPDRLARLRLAEALPATDEESRLFHAILGRHTNRQAYRDRALPYDLVRRLGRAAADNGASLRVVEAVEARLTIARLIAEADRIQGSDPRFRRELAAWVNPNRSRSRDGMPGYALGLGDLASYAGPLMIRTFDWGGGKAAEDSQLAQGSPLLAVLSTAADTPADWLRAGQALEKILLCATAEGVSASFLNQPIEVSELRIRLREALRLSGSPQLLLRMGYGPTVLPTPRRPVEDVLL